jgi:hypothetical protein
VIQLGEEPFIGCRISTGGVIMIFSKFRSSGDDSRHNGK